MARTRLGSRSIGWIFSQMSFAIPVHRLRDNETLLAFYHPQPSYPVRILIVPKKGIKDLLALGQEDAEFLEDLIRTTANLVSELDLETVGYRLIANGGPYQEIPQLHFHLVSGSA